MKIYRNKHNDQKVKSHSNTSYCDLQKTKEVRLPLSAYAFAKQIGCSQGNIRDVIDKPTRGIQGWRIETTKHTTIPTIIPAAKKVAILNYQDSFISCKLKVV